MNYMQFDTHELVVFESLLSEGTHRRDCLDCNNEMIRVEVPRVGFRIFFPFLRDEI